jgi:exoribonuclease R
LERNLKNLKNAIIFEAGIEIKKFSAHEKTEAETIAKKFSMNSYKSRPLFCNVLTVDGKYTKCHDDALFIEQLEKGEFMV